MIIFNAGVPRSGTVLVNAILRHLFKANKTSIVQANPHGEQLPKMLGDLLQNGQARHRTIIVHTHSWDAKTASLIDGSPFVTGFVNYRDPRDVCVSLMRLHDHDFEQAATMVDSAFSVFARTARDADLMVMPYEYLVADVEGHIFQIARRLGFWPGRDEVARIAQETSAEVHRKTMEGVRSGDIENLRKRQNMNRVMAEDPKTLINDRHIQSGKIGRWRDDLTPEQQEVANKRFAPLLTRYGYSG